MISRGWLLPLALLGGTHLASQQVPTRLALMRVSVANGLDSAGTARRLLDSLLPGLLLREGYTLVPADSVAPIWTAAEASVGGFFDPATGERSEVKVDQANQFLRDTVRARFSPEALVFARVRVVAVPFSGSKAKWDGIEEKTGARGGLGAALVGTFQGRLRALSLVLGVRRLTVDDTLGFASRGGVQLIDHSRNDKLAALPADSLLVDPALLERAVRLAIAGLRDSLPP